MTSTKPTKIKYDKLTGETAETLEILRQMTESDFHDPLSGQSPPEDFNNTFSNQKDEK